MVCSGSGSRAFYGSCNSTSSSWSMAATRPGRSSASRQRPDGGASSSSVPASSPKMGSPSCVNPAMPGVTSVSRPASPAVGASHMGDAGLSSTGEVGLERGRDRFSELRDIVVHVWLDEGGRVDGLELGIPLGIPLNITATLLADDSRERDVLVVLRWIGVNVGSGGGTRSGYSNSLPAGALAHHSRSAQASRLLRRFPLPLRSPAA